MAFNSVEKRNAQLEKENKKLRHYGMKLRAITTPKQHEFILQSVGCARFTFNFYLNEKTGNLSRNRRNFKLRRI